MKRTGLALASALLLFASASWADRATGAGSDVTSPDERLWVLRTPLDAPVTYNGALGSDGTGTGTQGMLYPAPNVAGFLAAVITHGLIVEAQKSKRAKEMQAAADQVLEPYRPALSRFSHAQLAQAWLGDKRTAANKALLDEGGPVAADGWLIEALPVFTMAQDQRVLTLELLVSVRGPGDGEKAGYQRQISMLSAPRMEPEVASSWLADQSRELKDTSSRLFSDSLDIAVRMLDVNIDKVDAPFRTIRYMAGATEKMERGQLLEARCGRMLIKTLRGTLMSVPVKDAAPDSCNQR